jgi:hypothetical protein
MRQVTEVKTRLNGRVSEYRCDLLAWNGDSAVVRHTLDREVELPGGSLPAGTVTYGLFWTDRNYNIYCWNAPDGRHLGDYFNIVAHTRIEEDRVCYRDLVVDVLVWQGREPLELDREELPADLDSDLGELIELVAAELLSEHDSILRNAHAALAGLRPREG